MDNTPHFKDNAEHFLQELFFPSFCLGCQGEGAYLCQDCRSTLEILPYQYCLCNKNPQRILPPQGNRGTCQYCQHKKLSGLYFALSYQDSFLTKKLLYQFKYPPHIKDLSKTLASLIVEHLVITKNNTQDIWQEALLVALPMQLAKEKRRGYNQAKELAKELAGVLKVPLVTGNLVKIKKTEAQVGLSAKERAENVKNAFAIKNPATFKDKKVFLVDDVYTTGSTMEECARVLRAAGATQVWGISVAREA